MPTIPPEPASPGSRQPDLTAPELRQIAESFGADAERYDRVRPRYPQALIDRIVADSPGPEMLDVGCGTGIVARQLQAAGATVLGVEPDERMAEQARYFGVDADIARIEDWDPAGRTFDAVVAGQAWHWIDPVAGAARAARALRPGGLLAVFWNAMVPPAEVAAASAAALRRVMPDSPFAARSGGGGGTENAYLTMCARAAAAMRAAGGFGEPQTWQFDWEHTYLRAEWLDQMPTFGPMTRAPKAAVAEIQAAVGAVIDELGGSFRMHYSTVAAVAKRVPDG